MSFHITIQHNGRQIRLLVDLVYQDEKIERYRVTARNKKLLIECTRPLFLHSAIRRPSTWRLIEGQDELYSKIKDEIITAIRKVIE